MANRNSRGKRRGAKDFSTSGIYTM